MPSTDGAIARAISIAGRSLLRISQATARTTIVGMPNVRAGRRRPFSAWPVPGRTDEVAAARRRRRSPVGVPSRTGRRARVCPSRCRSGSAGAGTGAAASSASRSSGRRRGGSGARDRCRWDGGPAGAGRGDRGSSGRPSTGSVVATRRQRGGHGDAGRSISLPVIARRRVCDARGPASVPRDRPRAPARCDARIAVWRTWQGNVFGALTCGKSGEPVHGRTARITARRSPWSPR